MIWYAQNIRRDPIYISTEVWRSLWLLSQTSNVTPDEFGVARKTTPDLIADRILREAIRAQHPQLVEHQSKIDALEKKLIESLKT